MIGPLLLLFCGLFSLIGVAAPIVSSLRHGKRGFLVACLGLPGAVLVLLIAVLYIGIAEGTWPVVSVKAGLAGAVGCVGLFLIVVATRSAWRAKLGPGLCPKCGYDLKSLSQCPECGRQKVN